MPAFFITFPSFAISAFIAAASCSGELATASSPMASMRSFDSDVFTTLTLSWFRRLMMAAGVLAGAYIGCNRVDDTVLGALNDSVRKIGKRQIGGEFSQGLAGGRHVVRSPCANQV